MTMPFDFGFFPGTKAADGDPLDVLVMMDGPAYPGVVVNVRLLGVIEGEQSDDGEQPYRNDRLIAVAEGSTERGDLRRLSDLDDSLVTQIETFFETYAKLTGKSFRAIGRRGDRVARRLLDEATTPA
jgi:inorganic pyrophosphatase